MSTRQNAEALTSTCNAKYSPEAWRQFTLRSWQHKVEINETGISCGCRTLSNINALTESRFIELVNRKSEAAGDKKHLERGYVYLFSDNRGGIGKELAAWIKKYKLGSCITNNWANNPNSGCRIRVWMWRYNGKKIAEKTSDQPA